MIKHLYLIICLVMLSACDSSNRFLETPPKVVGDKFGFTEGPIWLIKQKMWIFTDIPNNKVYSLNSEGVLKTFDNDSGYANGLNIDRQGNIWYARHDGKVSYKAESGEEVVVASLYKGKRLNSPNDLAIARDGTVWFTDPNFGISLKGFGPELRDDEQVSRGVYQIKDGELILKNESFTLPNGIAFSLDEKFLYVAESSNGVVYRFDFDGENLFNKRPFAKVKSDKNVPPKADGIKVDSRGNLYVAAGPAGFAIFSPSGEQLRLFTPDSKFVSNIAFGGESKEKLMVTGQQKVFIYDIK